MQQHLCVCRVASLNASFHTRTGGICGASADCCCSRINLSSTVDYLFRLDACASFPPPTADVSALLSETVYICSWPLDECLITCGRTLML